ncbi:hypothetical protein [Cyanobium sp. WAJ14-Wanaka]|uniref:hypothetical protein n=1 Tax=Cyanobium sp. WAJ14-Wanaka TaxID=2823725 RepID=UPI0020CFCAC0|nr:hypothetical protein [Cyanobium sp. WAJ14-Wanaka]MCP9775472.1 hypothetical protein [Cyanobium sp. WAJ14-Wanaka]
MSTLPQGFVANRHRIARRRRIQMLARVLLMIQALAGAKVLVHALGWETIQVTPLFTSVVASTVFLLGFLLNGVLSDFKESEKLPAEIATSLEVLGLEIQAISAHNPAAAVQGHLVAVADLAEGMVAWLLTRITTEQFMQLFHRVYGSVVQASVLLKGNATLQARLVAEMANILRLANRVETIRETSFVPLVYWLANLGTGLLCFGLVFMAVRTLPEALFFLAVIAFLLIFLIRLVVDLDNPFGFGDPHSAEDVSLDALAAAVRRIEVMRDGSGAAPPFESMG